MELESLLSSDVWIFRFNDQRVWVWQCISVDGEPMKESAQGFFALEACMRDATRHGYKTSPSLLTPND